MPLSNSGAASCRLSAQRHKLCAHLPDRRPVILAKIRNRLVIGNQPTSQPQHLNSAAGLTLKPPARLITIEITIDVELEQNSRMVRGPAGDLGINPIKPQIGQIELIDKDVDHTNRIVIANPV